MNLSSAPSRRLPPVQLLPASNRATETGRFRSRLVWMLERVQDAIAVSLCLGLFGVMVVQLRVIFISLLEPPNFHLITADILSVLILVEMFRLLIIYLQEQRVSIGVAVEVAIVSVLRESIVRGVLEVPWQQLLATGVFLLVLTLILLARVWLPPTFEGIDPEKRIMERYRHAASPELVD
ncbi:MAG: phosphate-starvation-inducible PsiE family protein [Limnothrix sp. BL-A-16]